MQQSTMASRLGRGLDVAGDEMGLLRCGEAWWDLEQCAGGTVAPSDRFPVELASLPVLGRGERRARVLCVNLVWSVLAFGLVALGVTALGTDAGYFTKDVASIAGLLPVAGALSQLGILLWCAASSVAGFSALLVRRRDEGRFLGYLCLLSAILALDDAFQLHEKIVPRLLGLDELHLVVLEGSLLAFILLRFSGIALRSSYLFLLGAIVWFAASLLIDRFLSESTFPTWHHLFEDGPKFVGILNWSAYCILVSYSLVGAEARRIPRAPSACEARGA